MNFKISISSDDYVHFSFKHVQKWKRGRYPIVFGLCFLVTLTMFFTPSLFLIDDFFFISRIVILVICLLLILTLVFLYFKSREVYKTDSFLRDLQEFSFNEKGFTVTTIDTNASCSWERIYKVRQSSRLLAIYIADNKAYLIPKKQLGDAQINTLILLLKQYISPSKF